MKTLTKVFMLVLTISMVTGCCDRRCGVKKYQTEAAPINLQEKLEKMKQEAGGKGSK